MIAIGPRSSSRQAHARRAIDLVHLARMTLGEQSLEREVLALFDRQADLLLARMRSARLPWSRRSAHTLKGSARGIGAFAVARAAEAVEQARHGEAAARPHRPLAAVLDEARAEIARIARRTDRAFHCRPP